ncbi:MAG: energy transducer TonB [Pyrinomonadaceae bacterium]
MRLFAPLAFFLATFGFSCYGSHAQAINPGADGDGVPGKIIVTPKVDVPKEARETGLGGNVRVKVSIDESGNITSVDRVAGPGPVCSQVTRADVVAMRNAAKEAAAHAQFSPAMKQGKAVPSSTWLNFTFPGAEEKSDLSVGASPIDGSKYTVKGDTNFSASPPPDFAAPVAATAPPGKLKAGDSSSTPKTINGGVLNGKAVKLPKPPYPPAARAVSASGAVSIQVLIDENGEVFSAAAVSGHPLLRSASAIAACESKFSPTQLSGNPVKVYGIITYNFVP